MGALEQSSHLGALDEGRAPIGEEGRAAMESALSFLFNLRQVLAADDDALGLAWNQPETDLGFLVPCVSLAFVIFVLRWP